MLATGSQEDKRECLPHRRQNVCAENLLFAGFFIHFRDDYGKARRMLDVVADP